MEEPRPRGDKDHCVRAGHSVLAAFEWFMRNFQEVTKRAKHWFESRDWKALQAGIPQRLELYRRAVLDAGSAAQEALGEGQPSRKSWTRVKDCYSALIAHRNDEELAETFFSSVTRSLFKYTGVAEDMEFVWFEAELHPTGEETPVYDSYFRTSTTAQVISDILGHYRFAVDYQDVERDCQGVAEAIDNHLLRVGWRSGFDQIDLIRSVFYRNKGAYLVGRVRKAKRILPLILPLRNLEDGVVVDAVLLTQNDASTVFSFTRYYFFVDTDRPSEIVGFLRTILPAKPLAELYIALGFTKHGKTVLYRELYRHLAHSTDRFEIAKGERGLVMTVFTLPSFDLVFKVIKDSFPFPKRGTPRDVKRSYQLVLENDRVGRLVDAQEFEKLTFSKERFTEELLEEFRRCAPETVSIGERDVVIKHLYTERRLYPLNLWIRETTPEKAKQAVIDYGDAVKDLAAAGVFPGDLLIKNFGVTSQGRVVFYDYDELCLLSDCRFRRMPQSSRDDEDLSSEPWFFVDEQDVFPEEFRSFLWPSDELRQTMEDHHAELFSPEFWRQMQDRTARGEVIDFYPYPTDRRFPWSVERS